MKSKLFRIGLLVMIVLIGSCEKDSGPVDISERDMTSSDVYLIMKYWYLWNSTVPDEDMSEGFTPEETLEQLRFIELDRWSFISSSSEFTQLFDYGKYGGYGFGHVRDTDGKERILYVFSESDFSTAGVQRGWQIVTIDGITLDEENTIASILTDDEINTSRTFTFSDLNNATHQVVASKKDININTVLQSDVYNINGKQTGYIAFQSFLETSATELIDVFKDFKTQKITKLILDLRYNSGGRTNISQLLGNLIAGGNHDGDVLTSYIFNKDKSDMNFNELLEKNTLSVNIDTLVFITSSETASASELLINGLKPFVPVFIIGENTSGKPVGMNQWIFSDKALIPVTFKTTNSLGEGEYYNGIEADYQLTDDIDHLLGDTAESNLNEAIHLIATGSFSEPFTEVKSLKLQKKVVKNLNDYFGAY